MTDIERKVPIMVLERVLKALTAKARGLAGRKQDSGLRAAIEVVEDLIEEAKNGSIFHDKR